MDRLRLMEKEIDLENSEILYNAPFTDVSLAADWEACSGEWRLEGGWITGACRENAGGMIYSKAGFPGDILMDFYGRTVPPCAHDLNFTWNAQGWDFAKNDASISYIAGLNGWWENKLGIERYPDCCFRAATPLFELEAGRVYRIQAGSIAGHCFIFIDGKLGLEVLDPAPVDSMLYSRVGFGAYCSHVQFKDLTVRKPRWKPLTMAYTPSF